MMIFTVVGDSNVRRHMNNANCRTPAMSSAEVKTCGRLDLLAETLRSIRPETTACILSCVTNFIADSPVSSDSVSLRIEPVLLEFRDLLYDYCQEQPDRYWLLAPPMYRTSPVWLLDGLGEVMTKFSEVMRQDRPRNLLMLLSFPHASLESDGVHLSAYSGFQFVAHLFDSAEAVINRHKKPPSTQQQSEIQSESIRILEDRVTVIEQDHKRLNKSVEMKSAVQAESADFAENSRFIICFFDSV